MLVNLFASQHPEVRSPAQKIVSIAVAKMNSERKAKGLLKVDPMKEREKISKRAKITYDEAVAEAIADYYSSIANGKKPRPLSKAIFDTFQETLNDTGN